jgi:hypothetical protein
VWVGFMLSALVTLYFIALAWYYKWLDKLSDEF